MENFNESTDEEYKKYLETAPLEELERYKDFFDDIYYNGTDDPNNEISDERYDMLKNIMVTRSGKEIKKIGASIRTGDNRTDLPFWLGSADKITPKDEGDLTRFYERSEKERSEKERSDTFCITEKLDGVSCLLVREKGVIKLYTRGNGVQGSDISVLHTKFKFFNIPELKEDIAIRGELIIKKKVFEEKFQDQVVNGRTYKNSRNMVTGLIGAKTSRIGLESINFVTYEIVGSGIMEKQSSQLEKLKKLGFLTVKYEISQKLSMNELADMYKKFKTNSQYEIDGIIIQINSPYVRNIKDNPKYSFAFKMLLEGASKEATVIEIEWSPSKWGVLKPVAIIKPVKLKDVTISRLAAHNAKYIKENNLGKGSIIEIIRSNDVIPYINGVLKSTIAEFPKNIPYVWDKTGVNIYTDCIDCVKLLAGIFHKLDIKHIGEETLQKFLKVDELNNFIKIISAKKEAFEKVDGFKTASIERAFTNLHNGLKKVSLEKIVGASGILGYGIGERKIEALLNEIPELFKMKRNQALYEKIKNTKGFDTLTAQKIYSNLKYGSMFIEQISPYVKFIDKKDIKLASNKLEKEKIVFSGFRNADLKTRIENNGGTVQGGITKETTILLVKNRDEITGKIKKAQDNNVKILTPEEFEKYFK